jgi:nucleotidyltransferase/DNA polymerase involved in DNA repair
MIITLQLNKELAIVNGEDLARYRVASKGIFHLVRSLVTGQKVERLGLDELFIGESTVQMALDRIPAADSTINRCYGYDRSSSDRTWMER